MKPGGELPLVEADKWRREPHRDGDGAPAKTRLPERPEYKVANRILIKARRGMASQ